VSASITLDVDITHVLNNRDRFERTFAADMAQVLGIDDSSRVLVQSITAASVVIDFVILPDSTGTLLPEAKLTKAFSSPGVSIAGAKTTAPIAVGCPPRGVPCS
jgi:hypothetical protein